MTLVVVDQVIGDISKLLVNKDIYTPMCFEFLYMPKCNIKDISHAIKLQYMHMRKSMTIILQGGIIQSILDAIKRGIRGVGHIAANVLQDIGELKRCLKHMDDQLTPSVTYGVRESYLYPIQLAYPPKYTRSVSDN